MSSWRHCFSPHSLCVTHTDDFRADNRHIDHLSIHTSKPLLKAKVICFSVHSRKHRAGIRWEKLNLNIINRSRKYSNVRIIFECSVSLYTVFYKTPPPLFTATATEIGFLKLNIEQRQGGICQRCRVDVSYTVHTRFRRPTHWSWILCPWVGCVWFPSLEINGPTAKMHWCCGLSLAYLWLSPVLTATCLSYGVCVTF